MTCPDSIAVANLVQLFGRDLKEFELEEIIAGVRYAEVGAGQCRDLSCRLVAELRRRGVKWSQLERRTGLPQTTLVRRAERRAALSDPDRRADER
jgi:hypothetical protein